MAAPSTNPVASATPPATAVASAAASSSARAASPPEPPTTIIHEADLYGQILGRHGATFSISSLLITSETRPVVGNKATLFGRPEGSTDDTAWVEIADGVIKTPLDASGKIQVKITSDEKKLGGPKGGKPAALIKGARVKIRWEW